MLVTASSVATHGPTSAIAFRLPRRTADSGAATRRYRFPLTGLRSVEWACFVRPGLTRGIAAAGGESKEGTLSGHPAYLAAKANGDRSMPGTWEAREDV